MKKEITLGQLLAVGVTIILAVFSAWVNINRQISAAEEKARNLEIRQTELEIRNERKFDKIDAKLDAIQQGVSEIKEKKADRK